MKTIKLFTTVLALAITVVATAVEKPKMDIVPLSDDRAVVSILNGADALFELSIHSADGELVYYKQATKPSNVYQKVFDFKGIADGNYTMDLRVNDTRLSKDLTIAEDGISVGESKMRLDPYFSFADGVLKLSYLNFDQEKMNLQIYGNNGLVYQSELGNDFNVATGFNLNDLKSGQYEVVLSSLNNDYSYRIVK